jgi:hypothetical protein
MREMVTNRLDVERSRYPEGPGERPASLGGTQALRSGMEPCSTPGKPTFGIGYYGPIRDHYAQQLGGQRRGTATHARPDSADLDWAEVRGDRLTTVNHEPVYLLAVHAPNRISAQRGGLAGLRIVVTDSS